MQVSKWCRSRPEPRRWTPPGAVTALVVLDTPSHVRELGEPVEVASHDGRRVGAAVRSLFS